MTRRRWRIHEVPWVSCSAISEYPVDNLLFGLLHRFVLIFIPIFLYQVHEFSDLFTFTERGFDGFLLDVITAPCWPKPWGWPTLPWSLRVSRDRLNVLSSRFSCLGSPYPSLHHRIGL